jgi:hypothetical protein
MPISFFTEASALRRRVERSRRRACLCSGVPSGAIFFFPHLGRRPCGGLRNDRAAQTEGVSVFAQRGDAEGNVLF